MSSDLSTINTLHERKAPSLITKIVFLEKGQRRNKICVSPKSKSQIASGSQIITAHRLLKEIKEELNISQATLCCVRLPEWLNDSQSY